MHPSPVKSQSKTMKAIVWTAYGPPEVLKLQEIPKPIPKANEVLIKIHATTVTLGDCESRKLDFPFPLKLLMRFAVGFFKPRKKTLGQELSGVIEEVGETVENFKPGDKVFASTQFHFGAYAEYACLPANHHVVHKPDSISFESAATIPTGGLNALHFIKDANIQPGEKVLINGAGGNIGTYAVQMAKQKGAYVYVVDSQAKLPMLLSIGADEGIDYQTRDFTQLGHTYDVVIDVVGKFSFSNTIQVLNEGGRLVLGNPRVGTALRGLWTSKTTDKRVIPSLAPYTPEYYQKMVDLLASGEITTVIDKVFPLEEVPEAHRYVEKGLKQGCLVIKV